MDQFDTRRGFWAVLVPEFSVRDLQDSLAFYVQTLGFAVKFARPEEAFAYIELGRAQIMLDQIPTDEKRIWKTGELEPPLGRGINFQIEVADVTALRDRAVGAGRTLFRPMEEAWYREDEIENGQRQFLIQDPDGYLLRFIEHLGERPARKFL